MLLGVGDLYICLLLGVGDLYICLLLGVGDLEDVSRIVRRLTRQKSDVTESDSIRDSVERSDKFLIRKGKGEMGLVLSKANSESGIVEYVLYS